MRNFLLPYIGQLKAEADDRFLQHFLSSF